MRHLIKNIADIGVSDQQLLDTKKSIRIVNLISCLSLLFAIGIFLFCWLNNLPKISLAIPAIGFIILLSSLVLNLNGNTIASRVFFLLASYCIIPILPITFGPEVHFQYYLFAGIGMPLIFFNNEIGWKKWLLVLLALPIWGLLELYFIHFDPLIVVTPSLLQPFRMFNDVLIFITVGLMLYSFSSESQRQINEIEAQKRRLKALNQDLAQFSYIVTHDLRAPLGGIKSLVEIIESHRGEFTEEVLQVFEMIQNRTKRMDELISAILSYSKIDKSEPKTTTFNIKDVVDEVIELVKAPSEFYFQVPKQMPEITGSYIQLYQILTNLIQNAVKHHHKSKGTIELKIEQTEDNFLRFEVIDDGPGIPSEYHNKVFGVFETAGKSRADSTGIGLAIVQKLVQKHGGSFGLKSEIEKGSTFWFTWPISNNSKK